MHCLGHMYALYPQNKTQGWARDGVECKKNGEHFTDEDAETQRSSVTLLKAQEELETEMMICLPSAQSLLAITCQTCQSSSILAYYPAASRWSAPFREPGLPGCKELRFHTPGWLGFCLLLPHVKVP